MVRNGIKGATIARANQWKRERAVTTVLWVNGSFLDPHAPAVSGLDRGLLLGYGVFETLVVESGVAFALTRHLRRLESSARIIDLDLPSETQLCDAVAAVLDRWNERVSDDAGARRGRLRLTVTGGSGRLGLPTDDPEPSVLLALAPAGPARVLGSGQGIRALRSPWPVNPQAPLAGAKTLSYAEKAVQQRYAKSRGADELLSATVHGALCEGSASNVFVEVGGELLTPPLSVGCLAGITRELILEWSAAAGLPVREAEESELPFSILDDAAHVAVTGSVRGIMPVTQLGERPLVPGPLTEEVARLFARNARENLDP